MNNYVCNLNYSEFDISKSAQEFLQRLIVKDVDLRPNAKEALEDDIFCVVESALNMDTEFLDEKYVTKRGNEITAGANSHRNKTKTELEALTRCNLPFT